MDKITFNTDGLSAKDKKIIKDNPGKTLSELLASGLSTKAYDKLSPAVQGQELSSQPVQPVQVTPTVVRAQPATRLSSSHTGSTSVWLYNNNTQNRIFMSRAAAEKLAKRNPGTYKILG